MLRGKRTNPVILLEALRYPAAVLWIRLSRAVKSGSVVGFPHVPSPSVTINSDCVRMPWKGSRRACAAVLYSLVIALSGLRSTGCLLRVRWREPCLDSKAMLGVVYAFAAGMSHRSAFVILAKLLEPTRLETRTKESNICASIRVANPNAQ